MCPAALPNLKELYDQLFEKEREHQVACIEYDRKITEVRDDLYKRIHEEIDTSNSSFYGPSSTISRRNVRVDVFHAESSSVG
ncbi:hypothetical protein PENTCL1PPCAC_5404 [Pristionchus entomophagus]|uniref:Inhibitor of growth protein N-terminal histone-binding domain-containing protein n=1 Tax=Pristionchus entomophagus TaxID=358040 RepID=A0AAV5SSQ5_9BILA|nr:hypothetical protein PENTCL1PPCAC_5404 [Pristionchus entomophagus]